MSKDYSRKRQTRQKPPAPKRLVAIVSAFLCGYLVANVFDFTSLTTWVNKNILAGKNGAPPVEVKVVHKEAPKPKFEFYTLLSKDSTVPPTANRALSQTVVAKPLVPAPQPGTATAHVVIPATVITASHATKAALATDKKIVTTATSAAVRESYLIQIASFNKRQDAEHLKASLVLRGFNVFVSTVQRQTVMWYRVTIGPFNSRTDAEKAQVAVRQSEHMNGIIRRVV